MKKSQNESEKILAGLFAELGSAEPLPEHMKDVSERVLGRLQTGRLAVWEPAALAPDAIQSSRRPWKAAVAFAAIALVLISAAVIREVIRSSTVNVVVKSVDGSLAVSSDGENRKYRSGAAGGVLTLADGSRVEMRSQSELSLERADDGVRIRLKRGSVIVSAAKQGFGHLYVLTRDVTVSVVGTVFMVNAEEEGSRVAVIQGEVHVRHGDESKTLLSGEQVSTAALEAIPVSEEIAWSRESVALLALLQQSRPVPAAPQRLAFEVVTIKPMATNGPIGGRGGGGGGFACQGVDGPLRARTGNQSLVVGRGRCSGTGVTLQAMIAMAYDIDARDVLGAPNFVPIQAPGRSINAGFAFEAKAEDPATTTTEQLKRMLQTFLTEGFKLKFRREPSERDGYGLRLVGNSPKFTTASGDEELPHATFESDRHIIKGKSSMAAFAGFLSTLGTITCPVVDKTGLTGIYDYTLTLRVVPTFNGNDVAPIGIRGGGGPGAEGCGSGTAGMRGGTDGVFSMIGPGGNADYDPSVFNTLQQQLGLRLDAQKVPFERIVVESAEKPPEIPLAEFPTHK